MGVSRFHWLYHKCSFCGSYNTRVIKTDTTICSTSNRWRVFALVFFNFCCLVCTYILATNFYVAALLYLYSNQFIANSYFCTYFLCPITIEVTTHVWPIGVVYFWYSRHCFYVRDDAKRLGLSVMQHKNHHEPSSMLRMSKNPVFWHHHGLFFLFPFLLHDGYDYCLID